MERLDAATALRVGGWDARYTKVLVIAQRDDLAIAVLDADSDLNLDDFVRGPDGNWRAGGSGSVGDGGSGMQGRVAYAFGQAAPGTPITVDYWRTSHTVVASDSGWWAFVAPYDDEHPGSLPAQRILPTIPFALKSKRWQRKVWRWPTTPPPTVPPLGPPIFTDAPSSGPITRWVWRRRQAGLAGQSTADFEIGDKVRVHIDPASRYEGHVVAIGPDALTVKRWDHDTESEVPPTIVSFL